MKTEDQKLSDVMHRWTDVRPSANFSTAVWRRIRSAEPVASPSTSSIFPWMAMLRRQSFPALAAACAGVVLALLIPVPSPTAAPSPAIAAPGSVTETMSLMLSGGHP